MAIKGFFPSAIKYDDLCELLGNDEKVQGLIRALWQQPVTQNPKIGVDAESGDAPKLLNYTPAPESEPIVLPAVRTEEAQWASLEELAKTVRADIELTPLLLGMSDTANLLPELASLIARASQWERLLQVWDVLAKRCLREQRSINASELEVLQGCQRLHNLIWDQRTTQLSDQDEGMAFDFQCHQRAEFSSSSGARIARCLLPSLTNAAGAIARKALVTTS